MKYCGGKLVFPSECSGQYEAIVPAIADGRRGSCKRSTSDSKLIPPPCPFIYVFKYRIYWDWCKMWRWKAIAIGKGSDTWIRSSEDVINLTDRQTQHCLWYNTVKIKQKTICSCVPHRSSRGFTLSRRLFSLLFPSYPQRIINIEAQNLLVPALWAVWKDPIAGYPFHPTTFARLVGCFLLFWDDFDDVVPCVVRLVACSEVVVGYRPKPLGQTLEEARLG